MRIYVAGPMTGLPDLNFPAFHRAAHALRYRGHEAINPAEINAGQTAGWIECMRADIAQLVTCDAIYLLKRWEKSLGARLEFHVATALDLHVLQEWQEIPFANDCYRLALDAEARA